MMRSITPLEVRLPVPPKKLKDQRILCTPRLSLAISTSERMNERTARRCVRRGVPKNTTPDVEL